MRAYGNTKGATLATLYINYYLSCHLRHYTVAKGICKEPLPANGISSRL